MADLIMINPASGDLTASLFSGPDSTSEVLQSVPKGTILKVTGSIGNYYTVEYDNGQKNITHGGTGMTGTIIAYPDAKMYTDISKSKIISTINNGTVIEITDDSNPSIIKLKAHTIDGWNEGFVDAKYIYRDIEELPLANHTRTATKTTTPTSGVVIATSGLKCRTGGSTSSQQVGAFNYNAKLTIHETKNGWHLVTGTSGWGDLTNVWVSAQYVRVTDSNSSAAASKSDATKVETPKPTPSNNSEDNQSDWVAFFSSYDASSLNYTANDEYYRQLATKYMFALGAPPKYNMDIDIQYVDEIASGGGRVMNKTILSNPSILSICPGKVVMFPNLNNTEKDSVVDAMLEAAGGNTSLRDKINGDAPGRFSGKLYQFASDTAEYAKYLNALCRASAIMLGIGDELMPNTSTKLKNFDYAYWTIRKKYNPSAAAMQDSDSSIFRIFWDGLIKPGKRLLTSAVDDTTYINFFLNGTETSVSESVTNTPGESPLSGAVNTVSSIAAQINYFTGSSFDVSDDSVSDALNSVYQNSGTTIGGIVDIAENFLKGGRMVLPKMVEGSTYGKTISCNMKFISPYGNKYSVFLKCIVPICHLIAMAYPRQISDNMFTYPFLIRCAQTGQFNVDLGIISSLTINRGGSDDTSWTTDTLATEWEVQMEIAPLVDELMISSTSHPVLFCKNEMLLDYLANFCGFDMLAYNLSTKVEMMLSFITNRFTGIPHSIENKLSDKLYNLLNRYFSAKW